MRQKGKVLLGLVFAAMIIAGASTKIAAGLIGDSWSPMLNFKSAAGYPTASVHLTTLCDGRVLFMGVERGSEVNGWDRSFSGVFQPQTYAQIQQVQKAQGQTTPIAVTMVGQSVPFDKVFDPNNPAGGVQLNICGGGALTQDGKVQVAGGTELYRNPDGSPRLVAGVKYSLSYDPAGNNGSGAWTRLPNEFVSTGYNGTNLRWYSGQRRVGFDGQSTTSLVVFPGSSLLDLYQKYSPTLYWQIFSVEKITNGINEVVIPHNPNDPATVAMWNLDYSHHIPQMQSGIVEVVGVQSQPVRLDLNNKTVTIDGSGRPTVDGTYPNYGAATAPLPMWWNNTGPWPNGSFITCGGQMATDNEGSCDVWNAQTKQYTRFTMAAKRVYPNLVMLPDDRIAIIGGVSSDGSLGQRTAEYFDPWTNTITAGTGSMSTDRAYHSSMVLLDDGSVLASSGIPVLGNQPTLKLEAPNGQMLFPDYVVRGKRPWNAGADKTVALGGQVRVIWSKVANNLDLVDASLMGHDSASHAFGSGQSSIHLQLVSSVPYGPTCPSCYISTFQLPSSANLLPPGCYMLFLRDTARQPSNAQEVMVTF